MNPDPMDLEVIGLKDDQEAGKQLQSFYSLGAVFFFLFLVLMHYCIV
jgi:hypothetical protein